MGGKDPKFMTSSVKIELWLFLDDLFISKMDVNTYNSMMIFFLLGSSLPLQCIIDINYWHMMRDR